MLTVTELMVFFENALAINSLSLDVQEGEIVGLIGSNSAGKTTFMNTVSGLINDMRIKEQRKGGDRISVYGSIVYDGEEITDMPPAERVKRGLVLSRERHPVFAESSVVENFKIAGYLRKKSQIRETMAFVFSLFPPLEKLKNRKAGFLSGGEQQMLAIGMAMVVRPRLLLLDEPLLGLSPLMQKAVMEAILTLNRESGITVLLSEQFARPVLPVVDQAFIVENGMLALSGSGVELMDNPEIKAAYFGV
jgi:branched-chain amino acid transport system ATP-binding protein